MGFKVIAPIGDNPRALFVGIKEFPTERIILITTPDALKTARDLAKRLKDFTISAEIIEIQGNMMEGMFREFVKLCSKYKPDELIVNVATGDRISTCAALSAAFANGLKAFGVVEDKCMLMPIMKLSYYHVLSENKMRILGKLEHGHYIALRELSKSLKMSVALVSYHINGNLKYKGLRELRLIEVKESKKSLLVKLSDMGNLLLKGYIHEKEF